MSQHAMVAVRAYLMNHLGKTLAWVVILFGATNQASLAVGPVDPDFNPPIRCVADGICHVNGCQTTPDPDCGGGLPDTSSPDNSSPDNSSSDTSCETGNEGEWNIKDTDNVQLKGDQVKFGGEPWVLGNVVGWGHVKWSVVCGFFTPRLTGFIHLNNASGKYARMRIGYYGAADKRDHSRTRYAANDDHYSWPVDLLPSDQVQILKARVCTMISDDGENFDEVECQTVEFD